MTSNATAQNTPLQTAMAVLNAVQADPALTRGRAIIQVDDRMDSVKMTIGQFLTFIRDLKPIQCQRNDLYRLNNGLAKHLEMFQLPQAALALVYFESQFYLVDGNTRKRHWSHNRMCSLPSHVQLTVMAVSSLEEAKDIYNCYDSQGAKKTNRDDLLSMLHEAGIPPDTLKTKLIAGGKTVSVVNNMARAAFGGSATPKRKLAVVIDHKPSFLDLDRLNGLDEGMIPGGGIWVLMRLYREVPREFVRYIDSYAEELQKIGTTREHLTAPSVLLASGNAYRDCRRFAVGTTGEKPMKVMFRSFMEGFLAYSRQLNRMGQIDAAFAKYLPKMKKDVIDVEVASVSRLLVKLPAPVSIH